MVSHYAQYIDLNQPSLWLAVAFIVFNPTYWNVMARIEHKTHVLTKAGFGSRYKACYAFAASIFTLGIARDEIYRAALRLQPKHPLLQYTEFKLLAGACFVPGAILVVSSMYALGVTGTYLGDYFGILLDEKLESFPFNVVANPMYIGSTLCFLATALWYESPAGLALTALVYLVYRVALLAEEPFTADIYAKREQARAKSNGKSIANGASAASGESSSVRRAGEL